MNNSICSCVFVKELSYGFVIIVVYADDVNIILIQKEVDDALTHKKKRSK